MTITTYQELKQAIQDYGKRTDCLSMLDTFIDLAESDIWDVLRTRGQEHTETLATNTTDRFIELPEDYIALRSARVILQDNAFVHLTYVDPGNLNVALSAGVPMFFTVTEQIELNRISDAVYDIEFNYYRELTPLSATATTNAVLESNPFIYLAGCMKHFYIWAQNEEKAVLWKNSFDGYVSRANRRARKGRYGPAPEKRLQGMVV